MEVEGSLVGRTLAGRFRIEKCIGRGGMATVYSAHVESGERAGTKIALKVVNRELTRDPTVLRRFHREAKAAAKLKHPNTVEVYEYGVDGSDAFIAMELALGQDLLQALSAENPMRQARAAFIVSQICAGLSAAHSEGIIHRDLKPENVMLMVGSEPGVEIVKVLDFGIAKIVENAKPGNSDDDPPSYVTKTALTRVGTIVGTPSYMSPEQCRGGELDGRSDVYSCGILLYQILTGEVPFTGETPLHTAMRHIHAQPKPPSELRKDLAPALEKIVLKALAKWPGERHQTADAMREELLAVLPSLPGGERILGQGFALGVSSSVGRRPAALANGSGASRAGAVVIPGQAKPEAVMDATELVIPTDPRMGHGALGAGKLGSVRLSALGPKPASRPPTGATPTGPVADGGSAALPGKASPAAPQAARTRASTPLGAPGKTPVAPTGAHAATASRAIANTLRGGVAVAPAKPAQETTVGLDRDSMVDGPRTLQDNEADDAPTGARPPREGGVVQVATRSGTIRPARPTETGLTPTAQIARDRIASVEAKALEPETAPQDDDEPRTFIRTPPASTHSPQAFSSEETSPPPSMANPDSSYPDDRTPYKTLVMDEPKAPTGAPASFPQGRGPQVPRTLDAAPDSVARARIDAAYDTGVARAAQGIAAHAAMQSAMEQPNLQSGAQAPMAPSFGAAPIMQAATAASSRAAMVAQAPPPTGTIRLPPEAAQKAVAAAHYQQSLVRADDMRPIPEPVREGARGKLEELSRGAILLIGISLGLFVALIGLVVVILTK